MRSNKDNKAIKFISVIIPVKGREEKFLRAVKSVRMQVNVQIELIIIDDGSKIPIKKVSNGGAIIKTKLFRNKISMNAAYSRNIGIKNSKASIIAFLDSDDQWEKDHLKIGINYIEKYDCLFIGNHRKNFISNNIYNKIIPINPYKFLFEGLGDFRTSTFIIKKSLINKFQGFDASLNKHQDWDLALRICSKNPYLISEKNTVLIDKYDNSRMSKTANVAASMKFLDKHKKFMRENHKLVFFEEIIKKLLSKKNKSQRKEMYKEIYRNKLNFFKSFKLTLFFFFPSICNSAMKIKKYFTNKLITNS